MSHLILPLVVCLGLAVQAAWAQDRRRPQQPPNLAELREHSLAGKFVGVENGAIRMTNATNHPFLVNQIPQTTKLAITGTAQPDYLRGGLLVSFIADVNEKGLVAEPVKELAVDTPSETTKPGMFREDRDNKESTRFFVRGTVRTFKDGKLTLSAGLKQVQATLAPDAKITIESTDLNLVKPGDAVTVAGRLFREYRSEGNTIHPGIVYGEKIEIKLAEPVSGSTKKRRPAK